MSEAVQNYPEPNWDLPGMRPLQFGLIATLIATSLAGILSNPLFTLANDSVAKTPILQAAIANQKSLAIEARKVAKPAQVSANF